jgi:hypothetical protein
MNTNCIRDGLKEKMVLSLNVKQTMIVYFRVLVVIILLYLLNIVVMDGIVEK